MCSLIMPAHCSLRQVTFDGFERTFWLNHMAYFLLTNLLLERIIANTPAAGALASIYLPSSPEVESITGKSAPPAAAGRGNLWAPYLAKCKAAKAPWAAQGDVAAERLCVEGLSLVGLHG
jgi:hypothetical protein